MEEQVTFWSQHGGEIIIAILGLLSSAITGFYFKKEERKKSKKEIEGLQTEIDKKKQENTLAMTTSNSELMKAVTDLNTLVLSLQAQVYTLRGKVHTLELTIAKISSENKFLQEEKAKFEEQIDLYKAQIETITKQLKLLQIEKDKLEKQIKDNNEQSP